MEKEINTKLLEEIVKKLMVKGKGILAADESNGTADRRLEENGIEMGGNMRLKYRDLFLCTDGMENFVSGVIFYDETFWQKNLADISFPKYLEKKGIIPGIKVDLGAKDFSGFPDEKITVGLDDLHERAEKYFAGGARFAKWRAVIKIDEANGLPTDTAIEENLDAMARYARICEEVGLVPICEPEVLLTGPHSISVSEKIIGTVLVRLFKKLETNKVYLPGIILKTSMVINGDQNPDEASPEEVAEATVRVLTQTVPKNIGGVVFLSGGQTSVEATAHLDAIAEIEKKLGLPFEIAFSYARALQESALRIWQGKDENVPEARTEFLKRLKLNKLADSGDYNINLEYLD